MGGKGEQKWRVGWRDSLSVWMSQLTARVRERIGGAAESARSQRRRKDTLASIPNCSKLLEASSYRLTHITFKTRFESRGRRRGFSKIANEK